MPWAISAKSSFLDIWHGSEYVSVNRHKAKTRGLVNLMYSHRKFWNDSKIFVRCEIWAVVNRVNVLTLVIPTPQTNTRFPFWVAILKLILFIYCILVKEEMRKRSEHVNNQMVHELWKSRALTYSKTIQKYVAITQSQNENQFFCEYWKESFSRVKSFYTSWIDLGQREKTTSTFVSNFFAVPQKVLWRNRF